MLIFLISLVLGVWLWLTGFSAGAGQGGAGGSVPSPRLDLLVKKKLVFVFIDSVFFFPFESQSDANCPSASILKQSKQNWARLWSTIKRPLSVCISERLRTPPTPRSARTPPHHLSAEASLVQPRRGRSMPCLCQFKHGMELFTAICAAFTVWCTTQTGPLQVCKRAQHFICFEPLPGCRSWQLLSRTEEQMSHSCAFNVTLHKMARLLGVTLKMFGPWAMDHSQEIYSFPTYGCISSATRTNNSVSFCHVLQGPASSPSRPGAWFRYLIRPKK